MKEKKALSVLLHVNFGRTITVEDWSTQVITSRAPGYDFSAINLYKLHYITRNANQASELMKDNE